MKQTNPTKIISLVIVMLLQTYAFAHGSLSARIAERTNEIANSPNNAKLFYERGFLYQQHKEFTKAIKDYNQSQKLGFDDSIINFRKSQSYYYNDNFQLAEAEINLYIKSNPSDVKGLKLFAQIQNRLENYPEALSSYWNVLINTIDIRPEDIIECSEIALNVNPSNYDEPLKIIDFGLNKIGSNTITLLLKKLDYYKFSNQQTKSLELYNHFIESVNRKEFWYYKKATYLVEINKKNDAKIALQQALFAIDLLNLKVENAEAIINLKTNITQLQKTIYHE